MTTIAWDGKLLAADSARFLGDFVVQHPVEKIRVVGNFAFAMCGCVNVLDAWIKWFHGTQDPSNAPKGTDDDGTFLVLDPNRRLRACGAGLPYLTVMLAPIAFGSGREFAIGALLAGLDAPGAVDVACRADVHTRGPVRVLGPSGLTTYDQG